MPLHLHPNSLQTLLGALLSLSSLFHFALLVPTTLEIESVTLEAVDMADNHHMAFGAIVSVTATAAVRIITKTIATEKLTVGIDLLKILLINPPFVSAY